MAIPLPLVEVLTRQVIAEEIGQIVSLLEADLFYLVGVRLRELQRAIELKPMDIDPQ